jgi:MSHA biogenesis protein MshJ
VLDPDEENRAKIAQLKSTIGQQSAELSALSETFVSPQDMPELLKGLLQKNSKIQNSNL